MKEDQCREIFLNFFIKLAINNNIDKTEKEVIKRSLYLLNKLFIIWPELKFKLESLYRYCIVYIFLHRTFQAEITTKFMRELINRSLITHCLISLTLCSSMRKQKMYHVYKLKLPNTLDSVISLLNVQRLNNSFYDVNDNPYLIKLMISIIEKLSKIRNIILFQ